MDSNQQSQAALDLRQLFIQPYTPYWFSKNLNSSEVKVLSVIPNIGIGLTFFSERRHWAMSRNKLHIIA